MAVDDVIRLQELAELAVFVPEVAKQHDEVFRAIAFVSTRERSASFWLDEITRRIVDRFDEDFVKPEPILPTVLFT